VPRVSPAHELEVRERIVVAALSVFAERGFHRATMQDVVRASGLSVGAIYTYFRSKDELFLASCDFSSSDGFGQLGIALTRGATAIDKLAIAVDFFLETVDSEAKLPGTSTFMVQAWAEADQEPAVREMLVRRREQLTTVGQILLREGIARGELPPWLDVEALSAAYTAMLDGLTLLRVEAGAGYRRETAERQARSVLELLVAAAAAKRPSLPQPDRVPYVPAWDRERPGA
jgi:AcrR family transcriptional regulator